jgi:hypothetical protein
MTVRQTTATTLMVEALRLVQVHGWPVVPGTHLAAGACSCLDPRCAAPGLHPAMGDWRLRPAGGRAGIESWWTEHPRASIVVPTGTRLDVLDLPPAPGREVLAALRRYPENLGPVASTAGGRVLFFVQPGARDTMAGVWRLRDAEHEQGLDWDLRLHERGDYVVAPPSGLGGPHSVSWLVRPHGRDTGVRPLPSAARLLPLVAASCHGHAAQQPA